MSSPEAIFSENLLLHKMSDFRLSSITNIRETFIKITELTEELKSGKIAEQKEEAIKSRFITAFFGDILGFNYGNSNKWQLKEEKKSKTDGSKPDACLGYFFIDDSNDKVRALIEIKDANTNLDIKQNRKGKQQTPVEQAFEYVAKSGGECKWVIVSNIKETRFYPSLDRSKCQIFYLDNLIEENNLKELLFLFHKDRFIKENEKSATDKLLEYSKTIQYNDINNSLHIIDKLYDSIKRFEGLVFVDPNFLATTYPFNILNEHVWHYENRTLFTLNTDIFKLLNNVSINQGEILFNEELQQEIFNLKILEPEYKLKYIFTFLNNCLINKISAINNYELVALSRMGNLFGFSIHHPFNFKDGEEGLSKNIILLKEQPCDCISCNYRSFDFNKLVNKLKSAEDNFEYDNAEYAYGNYLTATNNFKKTYNIYKSIGSRVKGKEGKSIEYFLSKYNTKMLHNLISDHQFNKGSEIKNDIKSIDLDKIIYDEIEFEVDKNVKDYLIDIKESNLIYKLQDEIDELVFKISKLKSLYKNGGKQTSGPNLYRDLMEKYFLLYLHINQNYIVYDIFKGYKSLTEKVFKGLVISQQTPEFSLPSFTEFFLTEAILHINPNEIQEILNKTDNIKVDDGVAQKMLDKLYNFTSSYYNNYIFGPTENILLSEYLNNHRFKDRFTNIFTNIFTILSKIELVKDEFDKCKSSLLIFLKLEKDLAWYDLKEFCTFIYKKGHLFKESELYEILTIAASRYKHGNNKYCGLIEILPQTLCKFYPDYKIDNIQLIKTLQIKSVSENGIREDYLHLLYLPTVCNEKCTDILFKAFEDYLDKEFHYNFYEAMLLKSNYDYKIKNYFQLYSDQINSHKGTGYKFGKSKLTDLYFINYIFILYKFEINFDRKELKVFTKLNDFESWLLNPNDFDYSKFNAQWLIDLIKTKIIERIKNNTEISNAINNELEKEFNPILAEIKYKYFIETPIN